MTLSDSLTTQIYDRFDNLETWQQQQVLRVLETVGLEDSQDPDYDLQLDDAMDVVLDELDVNTYAYDLFHANESERIDSIISQLHRVLQ